MKKVPIVILASGRGSNFTAIVREIQSGRLHADLRALISDRSQAGVVEMAKSIGIPALVVEAHTGETKQHYDQRLLDTIQPLAPHFLVMAGYTRLVSGLLLHAFRSERGYFRVTNIHPSLLPAFPGLQGYAQAFRYGVHVAGVTVHLVEETMDSGPICAQKVFSIAQHSSIEEVEKKGLQIEHRLYPETLRWVLPEEFQLEDRQGRYCVRPR